ncbi:MAG: hypothetical protein M0T85_01760 [Dehalococcoidales bacterium]|nr:hypothetical protein [Dehalococcoidales bacterium]
MKFVIEQQPATIAFSGSNAKQMLVGSKPYWVTGMLLDLELAKTDGAGPTTTQDFLYRSITSLSLKGGGRPYIQIGGPDLRSLYWDTRVRLRGRSKAPDMQAGAVTFRHQLPLIFGVLPIQSDDSVDLFDRTAGIAPDQDLTLQLTWAAAGSLTNTGPIGTNRLIGDGTLMRVTLLGIVPESPEEEPKYYPAWQSSQWAPPQQYTGKSGTVDIPTGYFIRRSLLMFLNGVTTGTPADNRTDGMPPGYNAVSEIGIKTADGRFPLDATVWDFTQKSQGQFQVADDNAGVPGAAFAAGASSTAIAYNAGVGLIDFAKLADTSKPNQASPLYGLNMIGKQTGAVKLAFTVNASLNTNVVMLHEAYLPY